MEEKRSKVWVLEDFPFRDLGHEKEPVSPQKQANRLRAKDVCHTLFMSLCTVKELGLYSLIPAKKTSPLWKTSSSLLGAYLCQELC